MDVYLPTGSRRGGKTNRKEADFIAAEIQAILKDPRLAGRTIGAVSLLGDEQSQLIDRVVQANCDVPELVRRDFAVGDARTFQGAERDIMFLSMVADAKDHHALAGNTYEQRFNVAASRARDRMYLVRSVTADQLSPADLRRTLLQHFSKPLDAAESTDLIALCESQFERNVFTALTERGYRVIPQGAGGGLSHRHGRRRRKRPAPGHRMRRR